MTDHLTPPYPAPETPPQHAAASRRTTTVVGLLRVVLA